MCEHSHRVQLWPFYYTCFTSCACGTHFYEPEGISADGALWPVLYYYYGHIHDITITIRAVHGIDSCGWATHVMHNNTALRTWTIFITQNTWDSQGRFFIPLDFRCPDTVARIMLFYQIFAVSLLIIWDKYWRILRRLVQIRPLMCLCKITLHSWQLYWTDHRSKTP